MNLKKQKTYFCIITLILLLLPNIILADDPSEDISFEIKITDFNVQYDIKNYDNKDFALLKIPDEGFTINEGEAQLPIKRYIIEIPQNATPILDIISTKWIYTSLEKLNLPSKIIPVQKSQAKETSKDKNQFIIKDDYYSSNEYKQTDIAKIKEIGIIRGHRLALLEISPVQYNPYNGALKIMKTFEIKIALLNCDLTATQDKHNNYYSESFEEIFDYLIENHDGQNYKPLGTLDYEEEYLIITYDTFYDELEPFIDWKQSKYYNVTTVNTSEIPGQITTANITNFIKDAYFNWSTPPTYVLLVGDTTHIPTYTGTTSGDRAQAVDLYYVTVDGTDFLPDMHIGRFPASEGSDVTAMVNKTIFYEKGNFSNVDWIQNASFMAGNDHSYLTEATHNHVIDTYLLPNGFTSEKIYEDTYGAVTQDVRNSLNNGSNIAIFSGHGGYFSWVDGPQFIQSDVTALTNYETYMFVCSHACKTGCFNLDECFGETWLREPDRGAIAFWGASYSSYWVEDDILEKSMFKAWWENGIETIGGMTDMGLYYLFQNYGGGGNTKYYFELYNVLGDPSVEIWQEEPSFYEPPEITDVNANPEQQVVGGWVNISCNITDDLGVEYVHINITKPNGTEITHTMNKIPLTPSDIDKYYFNNSYSDVGRYTYNIWVVDRQYNQNLSENFTFKIGMFMNITILETSWNLISISINHTINKTDIYIHLNGTDYSWNSAINNSIISEYTFNWNRTNQAYTFNDKMQPGEGYWIYAYKTCLLKIFTTQISYSNYISNLSNYWNVFGLTCNYNLSKNSLLVEFNNSNYIWNDAVTAGIISDYIFGWNRINRSYEFTSTLEPGYGYWVFVYNPCIIKH